MKKFLSMILVAAMLLSMAVCAVSVSAKDAGDGNFAYVVDGPKEVKIGAESVTVDIVADGLEDTDGVWNLFALVLYDKELVATSTEAGSLFGTSEFYVGDLNVDASVDPMNKLYWPLQSFPETDIADKSYILAWQAFTSDPDAAVSESGKFFSITFDIPEDAQIGDSYTVDIIYDAEGDIVKYTGRDAKNEPTFKSYAPEVVPLTITVAPDCDHLSTHPVNVSATCGTDGYNSVVCDDCGWTVSKEILPATGLHTEDGGTVTVQPTCTAAGTTVYKCDVCGQTIRTDNAFPVALGHDYVNHEAKEATLTEDGWNAYRTCSRCDYSELVIIPALGQKGWNKTADGKWFYIKDNNTLAQNEWFKDSKGWCFLGEDTYMVTGQPVKDSKGWCLVDASGYWVLKAGWNTVGGHWYYVKADGYLVTNGWMKDSKGWCYLDEKGTMLTATTLKDSKGWCLVDKSGYWVTKAGWNTVNGDWYYVKAGGYLVTNGWMKDSKGWCYLDEKGKMMTATSLRDSKGWCLVDESGYWVTKEGWKKVAGNWYYIQKGGYLKTSGWMKDSIGWCYLDPTGLMLQDMAVKDSTGWCLLDETGYWVLNDGDYEITASYEDGLAPGTYHITKGYIDTEIA